MYEEVDLLVLCVKFVVLVGIFVEMWYNVLHPL